jgi:hypothetical protein
VNAEDRGDGVRVDHAAIRLRRVADRERTWIGGARQTNPVHRLAQELDRVAAIRPST